MPWEKQLELAKKFKKEADRLRGVALGALFKETHDGYLQIAEQWEALAARTERRAQEEFLKNSKDKL